MVRRSHTRLAERKNKNSPSCMRLSHREMSQYKRSIILKVFIIRLFNSSMKHVLRE